MTFDDLRILAAGYQPAKLLLTALEAGVFDALAEGPYTAAEAAQRLALDSRATEIALDGLAALEIVEKEGGRYRNGEAAGRYLVGASPDYRGEILRHLHNTWEDWDGLGTTWKTGRPAMRRKTQQLPSSAAGLRSFILGMENLTRELAPDLADRLPLEGCRKALDLGAGPGNYALAFVRRWPGLRAVHFDLPSTSELARELVAGQEGSDRVSFLAGDFLTAPLGEGYDFVWASQVIHMLGGAEIQTLLGRVGECLAPGGLLAIHDHFVDADRTSPRSAALFAVHMLAATERGRTYSFEEVEGWLREAGLRPEGRLEYGGPARIALARKGGAG